MRLIKCSKRVARQQFDAGGTIYLLPYKVKPGSTQIVPTYEPNPNKDRDFNRVVRNFIFFDCSPEAGHYPHFYL